MRPTKLVWTESAEDRLTGRYPGSRVVARAFAVILVVLIWLCCVALVLLVPQGPLAWMLVWVVTLGFGVGGLAVAAFGGRRGQRRWVEHLRTEHPHSVLIACTPADGMPWAVRQVARAKGKGTGRPYLLVAGFVVAVDSERIWFLSRRRSMVLATSDLGRIRRGTATIPRGYNVPSAIRSSIDLSFIADDGETIVVQLCPIPIDQEPLHFFRPSELGVIAQSIDLAIRGGSREDQVETRSAC